MGLFGRSRAKEICRAIQAAQEELFLSTGMARPEAAKEAREVVTQATKRWKDMGSPERIAPDYDRLLPELRADGVTDEDIASYCSHHPLEMIAMDVVDEMTRVAAFMHGRAAGIPPDDAAARVRRNFPTYGRGPSPTSVADDRPLPLELRDRVGRFLEPYFARSDLEGLHQLGLGASTSCNAWIRALMRSGDL